MSVLSLGISSNATWGLALKCSSEERAHMPHIYILRTQRPGSFTLREITRRPRWFWMWMAGQQSKPIPLDRPHYQLVLGPISIFLVAGNRPRQSRDE